MPSEKEGWSKPAENEKGTEVSDLKSGPARPMSFGERLVGLRFNPSNDDKVSKAKALCAALADLLHDELKDRENSELSSILIDHTYGEILNAQMNVVKVLTLKY